jgi:hypothetical protein
LVHKIETVAGNLALRVGALEKFAIVSRSLCLGRFLSDTFTDVIPCLSLWYGELGLEYMSNFSLIIMSKFSIRQFLIIDLIALIVAALLFSSERGIAAGPGKENDFQGRRVLMVGIDGCRRDVLEMVIQSGRAPHFAKLARQSHALWNMEAGGILVGKSNQPTISGPGWATLFNGVFADKHRILGNGDKFRAGDFVKYPHFFHHLRQAKPNAWLGSVVGKTWPEVNTIMLAASGENVANHLVSSEFEIVLEGAVKRELTDGTVTQEAVRCLKEFHPDVLFLHYLDVDHAGHQFGFSSASPVYVKALEKLDEHLGTVLAALKARPSYKDEAWLVMAVTDHGGTGKVHGGQSPEERKIAAFIHGPGIEPKEDRETKYYQTVIAPTILEFLKIPLQPEWGFEDRPLKLIK